MHTLQIDYHVRKVREAIKLANFDDALQLLEKFIKETSQETSDPDLDLDTQLLSLTARYNSDLKNQRMGLTTNKEVQNSLIFSMTQLLKDTRKIALENTTMQVTGDLEKLNEKMNESLIKLEKINMLMAQSRLLEIEITKSMFGSVLGNDMTLRLEEHIKNFQELLKP